MITNISVITVPQTVELNSMEATGAEPHHGHEPVSFHAALIQQDKFKFPQKRKGARTTLVNRWEGFDAKFVDAAPQPENRFWGV